MYKNECININLSFMLLPFHGDFFCDCCLPKMFDFICLFFCDATVFTKFFMLELVKHRILLLELYSNNIIIISVIMKSLGDWELLSDKFCYLFIYF